jgi:hypothetical protein
MVVEASLGMNLPYNKELQERNRLLSQMDVITHNPQWLGGGKLRDYVLPGQSGAYPLDRGRLVELQAMGGKINRYKKANKWLGFSKDAADAGLDLASKAVSIGGVNRYKKANKWLGFSKDAADKGLDLAAKAVSLGGKISRVKKATKWTGYAVDTANKGLDLASKAKNLFGFGELGPKVGGRKPRVPQAVNTIKSGGGRAARAAIVKRVMAEKGLGMIAASSFVKKNNLY